MKKMIYIFATTLVLASCSVENETATADQNFTSQLADGTNFGTYKGVFTTNNSQVRATFEVVIPQASTNTSAESLSDLPTATFTTATNDVYVARANQMITERAAISNLVFRSNEISFEFSADENGQNVVISNVVFQNMESSMIAAKHTQRAPVTPITGTYVCQDCGGHPQLGTGVEQTFNVMITNPSGTSTTAAQIALGTTVYNGTGVQNNCAVAGTTTTCDFLSGDGSPNSPGVLIGGNNAIYWDGFHLFNNETTGPNDCSGLSGTWTFESPNFGNISGTFVSDEKCPITIFTEDFQAFRGAGFQSTPTAGQLDSDIIIATGLSDGSVAYGATATTGDFARGNASTPQTSGGIFSFQIGSNYVLGAQPSGSDFNPGTFEIKIQNTTGGTLTNFNINYDIFVRNDQGRETTFNFSYSANGTSFTDVAALNYTSPAAAVGTAFSSAIPRSTTVTSSVAPDAFFYIRFSSADGTGGSGSRDEIGVDNIVVKAN